MSEHSLKIAQSKFLCIQQQIQYNITLQAKDSFWL